MEERGGLREKRGRRGRKEELTLGAVSLEPVELVVPDLVKVLLVNLLLVLGAGGLGDPGARVVDEDGAGGGLVVQLNVKGLVLLGVGQDLGGVERDDVVGDHLGGLELEEVVVNAEVPVVGEKRLEKKGKKKKKKEED